MKGEKFMTDKEKLQQFKAGNFWQVLVKLADFKARNRDFWTEDYHNLWVQKELSNLTAAYDFPRYISLEDDFTVSEELNFLSKLEGKILENPEKYYLWIQR